MEFNTLIRVQGAVLTSARRALRSLEAVMMHIK